MAIEKKYIDDRFPDKIGFYRTENLVIVYSQNMNLCQYSISNLKGFGLLADDIKFFANLIKIYFPERYKNNLQLKERSTVHLNLKVKQRRSDVYIIQYYFHDFVL